MRILGNDFRVGRKYIHRAYIDAIPYIRGQLIIMGEFIAIMRDLLIRAVLAITRDGIRQKLPAEFCLL